MRKRCEYLGIRRLLLISVAVAAALTPATSHANEDHSVYDFMSSHEDCVSDHAFNSVFHLAATGGRGWSIYVPNRGDRRAQSDVRRIDREIPRIWQTYEAFLGSSPGNGSWPVRVVILDAQDEVRSHGREVEGITTSSCRPDGNNIYIFVPQGVSDLVLAHEFFHAFQEKRRPNTPSRIGEVWWNEGTAEWAASILARHVEPSGLTSLLWQLPQAPLEVDEDWNPTDTDEAINGVLVLRAHPYKAVPPFIEYLATTFGEQPSQLGPGEFGRFLNETFDISAARSFRYGTNIARLDRVIDAALRNSGRRARSPRIPLGLGDAYAQFARSRMFGAEPEPIGFGAPRAGVSGSGSSLFRRWVFRRVALADGETVELEAPVGLTSDPVELMRPTGNRIRQVALTIEGDLPPEGRLFMQIGDLFTSPGLGYGIAPVIDLSREVGSTLGSAPPDSVDPLMGRTAHLCLTNAPNAPFRWPNTAGLRVMLVNASDGSPSSSAVRIGIKARFSTEACQLTAYMDPADSSRRLKPDGSGEPCPVEETKPVGAPDTWEPAPLPDPDPCATVEAPPPDPPIIPPNFNDPWRIGRTSVVRTPAAIGGMSGTDCDENQRERARDRRARRMRSESERIVDRFCDRQRDRG